ncbi:hypothetical protein JTB14_007908 [Gonioctena quinquepunctata]|nr:hypothetical protein JTB14_007908 [Gonioctena quinquepunctata]
MCQYSEDEIMVSCESFKRRNKILCSARDVTSKTSSLSENSTYARAENEWPKEEVGEIKFREDDVEMKTEFVGKITEEKHEDVTDLKSFMEDITMLRQGKPVGKRSKLKQLSPV